MYVNVSFDPRKLYKDMDALNERILKNVANANKAAALLVQKDARTNIQKGIRTIRYRANGLPLRYKRRGVIHYPSSPGEYPKSDTGRLVSSIEVVIDGLTAYVGSNLNYATFLENGTTNMEARPWLFRTYENNLSKIEGFYDDAIREAMR